MLNDLLEILRELLKRILGSRLFALALAFSCMFMILVFRLFDLQIVHGEEYLNDYVQMTEKTVSTPGTRGNIYDRNGNLLAYNKLAYTVSVQDVGGYPRGSINYMLLDLISILEKHGYQAQGKLEIGLNEEGEIVYTSSSEAARKRFLRDYYGVKSVDELDDEKGEYPTDISAEELLNIRIKRYGLDGLKDERGNPIVLNNSQKVQLVDIRYTMGLTAYRKYEATTITSYVDDATVAEIMEHTAELPGVGIEESTIRVYNDSIYFAPIIGYTGKVQEDQLEELQKKNPEYDSTDIVGRTGIEASMEEMLQGKKGYRNLVVNNVGSIMQVVSETQPTTGNDVYLTIDRDLQIGIYHLIEKQLAGILVEKLVDSDVDVSKITDASKKPIPVKDAYYQLINNNVLSLSRMADEEASDIEKEIYNRYASSKIRILDNIKNELMSEHATPMGALPEDMKSYMLYIYSYLSEETVGIIDRENMDTGSDIYNAWKEETISLRDFIYAGIADNWIDTTKLQLTSKYLNADDIYAELVDYVLENLKKDNDFSKRIFRYLINDEVITGRQLCLALYAQGVLPYDEEKIRMLTTSGDAYAYTFIKEKIANIEITPAQLALDPCTGGVVITDVNTGEVRALVTYPSYDNNKLSGSVDAAYYNKLQNDQSLPLYNNATQAKKAPGSTFKPITAIAGLEEGVIGLHEQINCTGRYMDANPPINCWVFPGHHGPLDVVGGIQNSCNYFMAEVAHRLSMNNEQVVYSPDMGIETLRRYASMFGLDRPSGIEIPETTPELTTEDPERSSMGQGTNSYANVQLSRYVAALANRGTVYDLTLLDRITDAQGNLVKDYTPKISGQIEIADSTWDAVQKGMRAVVSDGSAKAIFKDLEVEIAGKTGTAQENRKRANHAFFISYGPYTNPEICVTVNIPYGYASANAAAVAKNVYQFYYGYTDLEEILNTGALDASSVNIGD